MLAYFCFLLQADHDKSEGVKLNNHNSAEQTTLSAGIGHTARETLSKLQSEHISKDTKRLHICVTLTAYLALIL